MPEGRRLFPRLTVEENLLLGAFRPKARAQDEATTSSSASRPFRGSRSGTSQLAGSMSGGEQQMLALGRALMLAPKILLVDEPSVGLAPILVARTIDAIKQLKDSFQLTVLMAEQNFTQAMRIANRGYVIVHGKIAFEGRSADELNNNDLIRKFYIGTVSACGALPGHPIIASEAKQSRLAVVVLRRCRCLAMTVHQENAARRMSARRCC